MKAALANIIVDVIIDVVMDEYATRHPAQNVTLKKIFTQLLTLGSW